MRTPNVNALIKEILRCNHRLGSRNRWHKTGFRPCIQCFTGLSLRPSSFVQGNINFAAITPCTQCFTNKSRQIFIGGRIFIFYSRLPKIFAISMSIEPNQHKFQYFQVLQTRCTFDTVGISQLHIKRRASVT